MKFKTAMALGALLAGITAPSAFAAADMAAQISDLGHQWVKVYYQMNESQQATAYPALIAKAEAVAQDNPGKAEPMVWQAIILSCYAKVKGGFGAVDVAKQARDIAMAAAQIDDKALDAGAYASLGVLYYKVPGWPIGFGSDKKAKEYLDKALAISPQSIDVNYFYGDFEIEQGDKKKARDFLQKALQAPPRPGREDADAGRKIEIQNDLAKVGS